MGRKHDKKPAEQQKIALERAKILFSEARDAFKEDPGLSDRYVDRARKIAMKYKVKLPSSLKKQFCTHCHRFLMPGSNCTVRLTSQKVVYYCKSCRHYMRFPYIREIKARRAGK